MIRSMARSRQTHGPTTAATAQVHLSTLRHLPAVLEGLGVPVQPLFQSAGLHASDFENPYFRATFQVLDELLGASVRRSRCPHFGLLVGRTINLQSLGLPGRLASTAPTLGAALHSLTRSFLLHDNGAGVSVAVSNGVATLSYGIHATGVGNSDQIYDLGAAAMLNVMQQLCGPDWRADVVLLPRRRPADVRVYRDLLQAPIRFDSVQASVLFPANILEREAPGADALLHAILRDRVDSAIDVTEPMLPTEVRRVIRSSLQSIAFSRAEVARQVGLHPRTLVRRLALAGPTFQALLDETRTEVAKQLLHDTHAPVARISLALGYRDPSVFSRAFYRWTGRTPAAYRHAIERDL